MFPVCNRGKGVTDVLGRPPRLGLPDFLPLCAYRRHATRDMVREISVTKELGVLGSEALTTRVKYLRR